MPGRVNVKFVLVLVIVMMLAALGVMFVMYQNRHDTSGMVSRGDEYFKNGEYEKAAFEFQRALNKKPDDVNLILKTTDAVSKVVLDDPRKARAYVGEIIKNYKRAYQFKPEDPAPLEALFGIYQSYAEDGAGEVWETIATQAKLSLDTNPSSLVAMKYRGIAQANRMRGQFIEPTERKLIEQDLRTVLKADPHDRDATTALAMYNVLEAQIIDTPSGDRTRAKDLRAEARKLVENSAAAKPEDLRRKIDRVRILRALKTPEDVKLASKLVDELEASVLAKPESPHIVRDVEELVLVTGFEDTTPEQQAETVKRATALIAAGTKAYPDDARLEMKLAQLLSTKNPPAESMALFKKIADAPVKGTPVELSRQSSLANMALLAYSELATNQAERSAGQNRKYDPKLVKEAEDSITRLANELTEDFPQVLLLQGRLLMLKGDYRAALAKLDKADSRFKGRSPEALFYGGRACTQLNPPQLGAAADRFKRLLALVPTYQPARIELTRLYVMSNKLAEANEQIEFILKAKPDDPDGLKLKAAYLGQTDKHDQAIEIYKKLKPDENAEVAIVMAHSYVALNQKDKSRALLTKGFEKDPKDVRFLVELLKLTENNDEKRLLITRCRQAGGEERVLDIFEAQLGGQKEMEKQIIKIVEEEKDPLLRHLKMRQIHLQQKETDKAKAELDAAVKLNPDHKMVVDAQFDEEMIAKNWDKADALAGRAAKLNLDGAEGMFYYGRLEMARGRFEQAAQNFSRGLTAQPVNSEGWRLNAEALRLSGKSTESAAAFEKALELQPGDAVSLRGLAMVRAMMNQREAALAAIRKAYDIAPRDPMTSQLYMEFEQSFGDLKKIVELRRKIAQDTPADHGNRRLLAILLARTKQGDEARQEADKLVAEKPDEMMNVAAAAAVRQILGQPEEGRAMLQSLVNRKADKATAGDWTTFARYLRDTGDVDASISAYKRAMAIEDTTLRPATRELADLFFDHGDHTHAVELYKNLYEANAKDRMIGLRYTESLLRTDKVPDAEKVLSRIESEIGEDTTTLMLRAIIARSRNEHEKALELLSQAIQKSPTRIMPYIERGTLQGQLGNSDAALADLKKAVELEPSNRQALLTLAGMHRLRTETDDAIRIYRGLVEKNSLDIEARRLLAGAYADGKRIVQLEQLLEDSKKLFPKDPFWPRFQAQREMSGARPDPKKAIPRMREAYKLAPNDPQIVFEIVSLLIESKEPDDALKVITEQAQMVDQFPMIRAFQGRALFMKKETEKGTNAFTRAIQQCRNPQQIALVADQMVAAMGQQGAMSHLQSLATGPQKLMIEMVLAQVELKTEQNDAVYSRLKGMEPALPKDGPARLEFDRMLALVTYNLRKFTESEEAYRRVLKAQPNDAAALNNFAYMLANDMKRADEALPLAEQAVKAAPNSATVLDTLGWVQFKVGKIEPAYDTLQRSVNRQALPMNTYHLGEVLVALNRNTQARDSFESSKRLAEKIKDKQTLELASTALQKLGY